MDGQMDRQTNWNVDAYVAKSGDQGDISCKAWWLFSLVVDYTADAMLIWVFVDCFVISGDDSD